MSIGNLAIVERLDKALTVDNPVAYLYGVAKLAIRAYCYTYSQLITQVRGRPMVWTDSLDAPLCDRKGCLADTLVAPEQSPKQEQSDFARLYEAINALTPKQQLRDTALLRPGRRCAGVYGEYQQAAVTDQSEGDDCPQPVQQCHHEFAPQAAPIGG